MMAKGIYQERGHRYGQIISGGIDKRVLVPTENGWPGLSQWLWLCQHNKLLSHDRVVTPPSIFLAGKLAQEIDGINRRGDMSKVSPTDLINTVYQEVEPWQEATAEYIRSKIPGAIVYHGRDFDRHREDPINGFGWVARNLLASQIYALVITDPDNMPGPGVTGELSIAVQAGLVPFLIFDNNEMRHVAENYVKNRYVHFAAEQLPYFEKDIPKTFWMPSLDAFVNSVNMLYNSGMILSSNHVNIPSYPIQVVARHAAIEMVHPERSAELRQFAEIVHRSTAEIKAPKLFPMSL